MRRFSSWVMAGWFAMMLVGSALDAAPARAVYFSDPADGIVRMDPQTLATSVLFPFSVTGEVKGLYVDSPNGHIYWIDAVTPNRSIHRGNLDGTGATLTYTGNGPNIKDMEISPVTGNLIIGSDRKDVIDYDPVTQVSTTLFTSSADDRWELFSPLIHTDRATSRIFWSDGFATLWEWHPDTETTTRGTLPLGQALVSDIHHRTDIVFENGVAVPYSIGTSNRVRINGLTVGGLEGVPFASYPLPKMIPGAEISADAEGGHIFIIGLLEVEANSIYEPGLFRMNLDGTEFTKIYDAHENAKLALDTADLADTTAPMVEIFSPIGGTTNSQFVNLFGSIADDTFLIGASWSHDGIAQGAVDVFNGDFSMPGVVLHPGENLLEITATDLVGNTGTAQVTLDWEPVREVAITNDETVSEGRKATVRVLLDSPGDVAGMTFKLLYETGKFESAKVEAGDSISASSPIINSTIAGEVNVTFASAGQGITAGEQELLVVRLRARSVAENVLADFEVNIVDMSDETGTPIVIGTYADNSQIEILAREFVGDINSNGRLDTGDSTRMQAMLAGIADRYAWDEALNDLNGSGNLDSGDVIRVLRTVVGLEDQPSPPAPARGGRSNAPAEPDAPHARLVFSQNHGEVGEIVTLTVELENITEAFSGGSFALDYPVEALRLAGAGDHTPGAVVGGDAFLLWNLLPARNDYAEQSGTINFAASSPSAWPGSDSGGAIASFDFTVAPGASAQTLWEISIRDIELSTDSGYAITSVLPDTALFVGAGQSFDGWRALHFTAAELEDPDVSAWGADPDGDRDTNAVEYFTGSDPNIAGAAPVLGLELVPAADGSGDHCLEVSYQRSMAAIDATVTLQTSTDLSQWTDVIDGEVAASYNFETAGESVTVLLPATPGQRQYLRLRIGLVE